MKLLFAAVIVVAIGLSSAALAVSLTRQTHYSHHRATAYPGSFLPPKNR